MDPPLVPGSFDRVVALNVLDAVHVAAAARRRRRRAVRAGRRAHPRLALRLAERHRRRRASLRRRRSGRARCAAGSSRARRSRRATPSRTSRAAVDPAARRPLGRHLSRALVARAQVAVKSPPMAREIKMEELLQSSARCGEKAAALANEKDVDTIQRITAELEEEGRALEELARAFEKQELAKAGPPPKGKLEVVLTAGSASASRSRPASTCRASSSPTRRACCPRRCRTPARTTSRSWRSPRRASWPRLRTPTGRCARPSRRRIHEIEQSGYGEVLAELERLKADPNWLGGILHKKKYASARVADGERDSGRSASAASSRRRVSVQPGVDAHHVAHVRGQASQVAITRCGTIGIGRRVRGLERLLAQRVDGAAERPVQDCGPVPSSSIS